jgi:hypothetical protein
MNTRVRTLAFSKILHENDNKKHLSGDLVLVKFSNASCAWYNCESDQIGVLVGTLNGSGVVFSPAIYEALIIVEFSEIESINEHR